MTNSTFSGNTADFSSGGGVYTNGGTLALSNTIIANSAGSTDCWSSGSLTASHNLIKDGTCITAGTHGNLSGDPMLGGLTGSPAYFPIPASSPAFNSGDNSLVPGGVITDEAGNTRIYGGAVDMGAFEVSPACPNFPYTVAPGDTPNLIFAIDCANNTSGAQTLNLTNSTYTLTAVNNSEPYGATGLPVITDYLTIKGNGATITRSTAGGTPSFRLFAVDLDIGLTLNDLTVSNGNSSGGGGGVLNYGPMTVTNSTFTDNTDTEFGGAIYTNAALTAINSTFTDNSAGEYGGGIYSVANHLTLTNSTVSGNTVSYSGGGGGINNAGGTTTLNNTIIANNTGSADCVNSGSLTASHSLIRDGSCIIAGTDGNLSGNPKLGTLTGSPAYFPLMLNSPALNAGDNTLIPGGVTTDEAGNLRVFANVVDMGAYEDSLPDCPAFPYTVPAGQTNILIFAIACTNDLDGAQTVNLRAALSF